MYHLIHLFLWSNQWAQKPSLLLLHWLLLLFIILLSVVHVGEGALQQQIHIEGQRVNLSARIRGLSWVLHTPE